MAAIHHYKQIIVAILISFQCMPGFSQFRISDLFDSLNKANTPRTKADAYFDLSRLYSDLLKIDSALLFANKIKEFSGKDNYERGLGEYHLAVSKAIFYRRMWKESERHADSAIKIFAGQKDNRLLGMSYQQLGMIQGTTNNFNDAIRIIWTAIHYLKIAEEDRELYRSYFWLGRQYTEIPNIDSSADYYFKSLQLAEKLKNPRRIYISSVELGSSFLRINDLPKAYKFLDNGFKNRTAAPDKIGLRIFLREYAVCLALMHDYKKADSVINEFQLITEKINDALGKAVLNEIRGVMEYEKNNYTAALEYFREGYYKMDRRQMPRSTVNDIEFGLGKAEFQTGNYDSAVVHLRNSIQVTDQKTFRVHKIEATRLLSASFNMIGRPDSALYYFKNYALLKDSVLSLQKQQTVIEVSTKYESEKREQEIKILQKESEANALQIQIKNQQIGKQQLEDDKKSQQLALVSQQNEINKLDASQKALGFENEKKENEKNQAKLKLLEQEAAYQKLLTSKQSQQKKIIYISITAFLGLTGYTLYRYLRKKRLQNQQEVLNERLRISRELHDELGATLSGIAMYSHLTKEQIKAAKTQEVERSLNNIQQSAGEMVDKLSDIVWLVNPEKDSLQQLIERLEQYAEDMAAIKGMEVKIAVSPKLSNINLPVETRRNIYLFCKEAINNAVKYSHATTLELSMKELDNKRIAIMISDDGKGFDRSAVKNGNGLMNMKQRAVETSGDFLLDTAPDKGTKISLNLKIT